MSHNHGYHDDESLLTLECERCGQEFETMNHMRSLCGPCRRKKEAADAAAKAAQVAAVRGNQL